MKKFNFLLSFILISLNGLCQDDTTTVRHDDVYEIHDLHKLRTGFGPVIAYRGFGGHFLEAGITAATGSHGIIGVELTYMDNLKKGDEHISGYSIGKYTGFLFFETGINGTLFTDYKSSRFFLRPYLGFGLGGIATFGYGYNFCFGKNIYKGEVPRHEFRLVFRLPFGTYIFG